MLGLKLIHASKTGPKSTSVHVDNFIQITEMNKILVKCSWLIFSQEGLLKNK